MASCNITLIPVSQAKQIVAYALVDKSDAARIRARKWTLDRHGYARHGFKSMHREVMSAPDGVEVDHINGNALDNRRENLRFSTRKQNTRNGRAHFDGVSQYRGVSPCRWRAQICIDGKVREIGRFTTEKEAALAYDAEARRLFGEFARANFPAAVAESVDALDLKFSPEKGEGSIPSGRTKESSRRVSVTSF